MKRNIIKRLYLLLFVVSGIIACNSEPDEYTLAVPNDQMKLSASSDSITLERANADKEAVKFTWNDAASRGADAELTYYFRMYMAESKDKVSELVKIDPAARSISWTTRQINDLIGSWNVSPGEIVKMEAEVIAKVTSSKTYMKPEVSKMQFKVRGYDGADVMYIMAKSEGKTKIIAMNLTSEEGVYKWVGKMDPCEFWFTSNKDNGYPAYLKGAEATSLIYSSKGEGDHFIISQESLYDITIDVNKLTANLKSSAIYHQLFIVSSVNGSETATSMTNLEDGSNVFYWSGDLEAGTEIRFAPDKENTWPAFVPGANSSSVVEGQSGATMLKITKTAKYVVTVNLADMKLIFLDVYKLPHNGMWGIGDALVRAGWSQENAANNCAFKQTDLKNHPEIWTLTTEFQTSGEGAFKIITIPGQWWNEVVAVNGGNNKPVNIWVDATIRTDGIGDNKFVPQVTGTWTVKVDLHSMKITMEQ